MFDILEHIQNDKIAASALSNLLAPNGIAIITVPAFSFLWSKHDEHLHHFRRYNVSQIKKIFGEHKDISIQYIHYYNSLLFIVIAIIRLFRKMFNMEQGGDDEKIPNNFLNDILKSIFSLERFWLPYKSLPFGISIICIIKKIWIQ